MNLRKGTNISSHETQNKIYLHTIYINLNTSMFIGAL
uniref:Uncharacterized protein n=1 Tax=Lepeophtheirus salmonis TaxID=72036 RepID=A0A0K2TY21_LEPSM